MDDGLGDAFLVPLKRREDVEVDLFFDRSTTCSSFFVSNTTASALRMGGRTERGMLGDVSELVVLSLCTSIFEMTSKVDCLSSIAVRRAAP